MTPSSAAHLQTRKAASWLSSCGAMVEAAEQRLAAAIRQGEPGIAGLRTQLEGLKGQRNRAREDLVGWQRLSRRLG